MGCGREIGMQNDDFQSKTLYPSPSLAKGFERDPQGTPLADFAGMFAPNHLNHLVQFLQKA